MTTVDKMLSHRNSRASRNPWSVEPELPPDGTETSVLDEDAIRDTLNRLLGNTVGLTGELTAELDSLRPVLVREPSTETSYIAAMHRLEAARQTATEVKAALTRLDDGSYGWCVACLASIPADRLELRPQAAHCVRCG